ncbi:hypothetical protein PMZ80_003323 [Knufia obscura]|uniref:SnoaL-like domain-containing protein n=2 Tax=Knufia TaxID=430999 RepID=A0AAN8F4E0_9EURO|nr:hypothetical protein PMZ80_003323 [Knufia obscura]KAK5956413.1 hypothetical protein OHC33_002990 [Knufia fluminis]
MAPNPEAIRNLFGNLSSPDTQKDFFNSVSDNVDWWIVGHTPMSGSYSSKQDFLDATFQVLNKKVLGGPLKLRIVNVVGGGDSDWATVEMEAIDAKCKNGMTYDMRYCWMVRFGSTGMIEQVRAYLDTDLLARAIEQHK